MEILSPGLEQALIFFIYTSVIMLVIITVLLSKLLIDTNHLVNTLNDVGIIFKHELKPLIQELQGTLNIANTVFKTADNQVLTIKKVFSTLSDASLGAVGKAKGLSSTFLNGLIAGFKLFKR